MRIRTFGKALSFLLLMVILFALVGSALAWHLNEDPTVDCQGWNAHPSPEGSFLNYSGATSGTWGNSTSVDYSYTGHFADGDISKSGHLEKPGDCVPPPPPPCRETNTCPPEHHDDNPPPASLAFCVSTQTPFAPGDTISVVDDAGHPLDGFSILDGNKLSINANGNATQGVFTASNQNGATWQFRFDGSYSLDLDNHGCVPVATTAPAPAAPAVIFNEGGGWVALQPYTLMQVRVSFPTLGLSIPLIDGSAYVTNNVLFQPSGFVGVLGDDFAVHQGRYPQVGASLQVGDEVDVGGAIYHVRERRDNIAKADAARMTVGEQVIITCSPDWMTNPDATNIVFVIS